MNNYKALFILLGFLIAFNLTACRGGKNSNSLTKVALISDSRNQDASISQLKGSLLTANPALTIIDLNHEFSTTTASEASYLLEKSTRLLPAGTIVIVMLDGGFKASEKSILIQTRNGKYYIGQDTGIFTHVMQTELVQYAVEINRPDSTTPSFIGRAFLGRDLYAPVAQQIISGKSLEDIGTKLKEIVRLKLMTPTVLGNKINGQIIHIDRFGNAITNIRPEDLPAQVKGKLLKLSFKGRIISLPFWDGNGEAPKDRIFCVLNTDGELQFSLRESSAAATYGFKAGDIISLQN